MVTKGRDYKRQLGLKISFLKKMLVIPNHQRIQRATDTAACTAISSAAAPALTGGGPPGTKWVCEDSAVRGAGSVHFELQHMRS